MLARAFILILALAFYGCGIIHQWRCTTDCNGVSRCIRPGVQGCNEYQCECP